MSQRPWIPVYDQVLLTKMSQPKEMKQTSHYKPSNTILSKGFLELTQLFSRTDVSKSSFQDTGQSQSIQCLTALAQNPTPLLRHLFPPSPLLRGLCGQKLTPPKAFYVGEVDKPCTPVQPGSGEGSIWSPGELSWTSISCQQSSF